MKFALVDGKRQEAQPKLSGTCPTCNHPMIAKCGEVKIRHWAHLGSSNCDPWWENETEWHRAWKGEFPVEWQEFVHRAENGEKHIADVKTERGWVIEFQHSYINPEEHRSRDAFYQKLVWVVDGTRRKRDKAQLIEAWENGRSVHANIRKTSSYGCVLLEEWARSNAPIVFDFGEEQPLWWLLSCIEGRAYIAQMARTEFIGIHRSGAQVGHSFDELVNMAGKFVAAQESLLQVETASRASRQPLPGFQRYLNRQNSRRRRF